MIELVLLSIFTIYLVLALSNSTIKKIFGKKMCAICGGVSLTWISLIVLKLIGYVVNPLIVGILMGESITGIMYLYEKKVKRNKKLLTLRIFVILFGTAITYFLLSGW